MHLPHYVDDSLEVPAKQRSNPFARKLVSVEREMDWEHKRRVKRKPSREKVLAECMEDLHEMHTESPLPFQQRRREKLILRYRSQCVIMFSSHPCIPDSDFIAQNEELYFFYAKQLFISIYTDLCPNGCFRASRGLGEFLDSVSVFIDPPKVVQKVSLYAREYGSDEIPYAVKVGGLGSHYWVDVYPDIRLTFDIPFDDMRRTGLLRTLLLISGIEPNPGPNGVPQFRVRRWVGGNYVTEKVMHVKNLSQYSEMLSVLLSSGKRDESVTVQLFPDGGVLVSLGQESDVIPSKRDFNVPVVKQALSIMISNYQSFSVFYGFNAKGELVKVSNPGLPEAEYVSFMKDVLANFSPLRKKDDSKPVAILLATQPNFYPITDAARAAADAGMPFDNYIEEAAKREKLLREQRLAEAKERAAKNNKGKNTPRAAQLKEKAVEAKGASQEAPSPPRRKLDIKRPGQVKQSSEPSVKPQSPAGDVAKTPVPKQNQVDGPAGPVAKTPDARKSIPASPPPSQKTDTPTPPLVTWESFSKAVSSYLQTSDSASGLLSLAPDVLANNPIAPLDSPRPLNRGVIAPEDITCKDVSSLIRFWKMPRLEAIVRNVPGFDWSKVWQQPPCARPAFKLIVPVPAPDELKDGLKGKEKEETPLVSDSALNDEGVLESREIDDSDALKSKLTEKAPLLAPSRQVRRSYGATDPKPDASVFLKDEVDEHSESSEAPKSEATSSEDDSEVPEGTEESEDSGDEDDEDRHFELEPNDDCYNYRKRKLVNYMLSFHGNPETYSYSEADPEIFVEVHKDGSYHAVGRGLKLHFVRLPMSFYVIAARSMAFPEKDACAKNIAAGLRQDKDIKIELARDPVFYAMHLQEICFILAAIVKPEGRLKWLSSFPERVPLYYTVDPPATWRKQLPKSCFILPDYTSLQCSWTHACRAAQYVYPAIPPSVPMCCDVGTNIAGLCKRLYPVLPQRSNAARDGIRKVVDQFLLFANNFSYGNIPIPSKDELLASALYGRPMREREGIIEGYSQFLDPSTHDAAMSVYLEEKYKAFWKKETYPNGSFKPPRFIMSLPLYCRGVQIAAMSRILHKIERITEMCNVKHLTADQITRKLESKFKDYSLVAETDFSSFESCIDPELKSLIENRIFTSLAEDAYEREFIRLALCRPTVQVIGPGFVDLNFHHIRMSGDYWTSLGNLLTNLVVLTYCHDVPLQYMLMFGLFEGDDGVFPAPKDPERLENRAKQAGVKLTFDIAPWESLSFCGNSFREGLDGELFRFRNPAKTLANLTVLFSADRSTRKYDLMLQRSKCISVLSGPWVPGASVFAACVEYLTRYMKVSEQYLENTGRLKEWSPYGLESCLPKELAECRTEEELAKYIASRESVAGGIVGRHGVLRVLSQMRENGEVTEPLLEETSQDSEWVTREGYGKTCEPLFFSRFRNYQTNEKGRLAQFYGEKWLESRHHSANRSKSQCRVIWDNALSFIKWTLVIMSIIGIPYALYRYIRWRRR